MTAGPVILGGGPAGAAAAIRLARAGVAPLLLERSVVDEDILCGGFLSWRSLDRLNALGLDADRLDGTRITRLALFAGDKMVRAPLPAPGMALSRRRLDALLRARAEAEGAVLCRGAKARALLPDGTLELDGGERLRAGTLFLATGKRDLRGAARGPVRAADPEIGLRFRLPADERLRALVADAIELHLFPGGYVGLVVQEDGSANACMALRKHVLSAVDPTDIGALIALLRQLSPSLAERLNIAAPERIDAVGPVPYGWRTRCTVPGLFRLGDQAACIPSLAGEGMGIALMSAEAAVSAWRSGGADAAPAYQARLARRLSLPMMVATQMRDLATGSPATASLLMRAAAVPGLPALVARLTRAA